jgi:N-acetylated-alpha-linked acidic dipeptidase
MTLSKALASLLLPTLILPPQFLLAQEKPAESQLEGYSRTASDTERSWEEKFKALPEPENVKENMRRLSARPHHVGSPYDKDNAEWMLAKFKEWGWDAQIENFYVLFPDAERACGGDDGADEVLCEAAGAWCHRSDVEPDG